MSEDDKNNRTAWYYFGYFFLQILAPHRIYLAKSKVLKILPAEIIKSLSWIEEVFELE